ncbi:hypothetical protein HMPREF0518_1898 [Lactobacillus helveticus DSM 20075 = CGMCC 1.1877]|nr:hypothetical protein HMPREF0518_1898 [Lactobacillus helveticus DSM 20075 = CGMCC 1.1877]
MIQSISLYISLKLNKNNFIKPFPPVPFLLYISLKLNKNVVSEFIWVKSE